jgi:uncharacterized protein with GYD domain
MPKYLVEAHFTTEGAKGIAKEGGTARRKAITKLMEGAGGKLESYYFAFGGADAFVIADLPDNVTAAALSLAVNKSGAVATKTIVLLTPEEMDQASKKVLDPWALRLEPSPARFQRAGASCYGGWALSARSSTG